jgi:hypothetical protein
MCLEQIVEYAPRAAFSAYPLLPCSVALMAAVPTVNGGRNRIKLSGNAPSAEPACLPSPTMCVIPGIR